MKQLYFVFAATAGFALVAGAADAATRYTSKTSRHELYQNYTGCTYGGNCAPAPAPVPVCAQPPVPCDQPVCAPQPPCRAASAPVVAAQPEPVRHSEPRKPNSLTLADPFFQPAAGRVASLTDIGWAQNKYNFEVLPGSGPWTGISGDWKASEVFIKEDLSIGITDDLSIIGMAKYSSSKYQMNWSGFPTDNMKDNGISTWGLGLQWRLFDSPEWVSHVGLSFQSADIANNFLLTGKAGHKFTPDTTIYGLLNLAYVMWDNSSYGNGIVSNVGQVAYIAFERDVSSSFYVEGGAGVFHKFSDQWSMNLEGIFGSYAWHSQLSAKAAVYWQPNDYLALGAYGKMSLWDSADSAKDIYIYSWCEPGTACAAVAAADPAITWNHLEPYCYGLVGISNYRDMTLGLNAIVHF